MPQGDMPFEDIDEELKNPSDQRLFAIAYSLSSGKYTVDQLHNMTKIDRWFLNKLKNISEVEKTLRCVL
jgi:hypothetical protein